MDTCFFFWYFTLVAFSLQLVFAYFRERQQATRVSKRTEKKLKEALLQIEDERRNTDQFKDQVSKSLIMFYFQFPNNCKDKKGHPDIWC